MIFYENGAKKFDGQFLNGKKEGFGISFYENGNKEAQGIWSEDHKHGKFITYTESGLIK